MTWEVTKDLILDTVKSASSLATDTNGKVIAGSNGYNLAVYSSGNAAVITTANGLLTFGTTSPTLTIDKAGTYLIQSRVNQYRNNASHISTHIITYRLRRTNNTASDIVNSITSNTDEAHAALTETEWIVDLPTIVYTTTNTNDTLEIWGVIDLTTSTGSHEATEANIVAQKLS